HIWRPPRPPSTSRRPTTGASRRSRAPRTAPRPSWCVRRWPSTPAAMRPAAAPRASAPAGAAAATSPSARRSCCAASAAGGDRRRGAPAGGGDRDARPAALRRGPDPGAAPATAARPLAPVVGLLQTFDVQLLHLHHGLHDPVRLLRILVSQQLAQHGGNDLPRQPELVLEPAALVFRSTGGQLLPQLVHFLLRLAVYEQGYRRRELELRAAVQ